MPWLAAACLLLAPMPDRVAVRAAEPMSRGRYIASRDDSTRGVALPAHEAWGWNQRSRLLADGRTEITVVSSPPRARPLRGSDVLSEQGRRRLIPAALVAPDVRALAEEIAHDAPDDWTISERVVTWVSVNVAHEDAPAHAETATATLRARSGSCVGRSRLAAELLIAAGVPARTVHGLLASAPPSAPAFRLHRFIEAWIAGLGWVPSDPGESVNGVDARHVFIATDEGPYDPEWQRTLRLEVAEFPLMRPAAPGTAGLPLVVAQRPMPLEPGRLAP